jgi:hypothetical protein
VLCRAMWVITTHRCEVVVGTRGPHTSASLACHFFARCAGRERKEAWCRPLRLRSASSWRLASSSSPMRAERLCGQGCTHSHTHRENRAMFSGGRPPRERQGAGGECVCERVCRLRVCVRKRSPHTTSSWGGRGLTHPNTAANVSGLTLMTFPHTRTVPHPTPPDAPSTYAPHHPSQSFEAFSPQLRTWNLASIAQQRGTWNLHDFAMCRNACPDQTSHLACA